MFLAKASTTRPIAMMTLIICLLMFGVLSFRNVGVDLLPQVDVPYVTISVVYPGASPDKIETTVAKKLEDAVVQVDGIKHITATCLNNFCQLIVEFDLDRNVDVCATDIREKVDLIREDLPAEAEAPQIVKLDVNAKPVVTIAVRGRQSIDELYDYADNALADRFSTLGGVAKVELIGGEEREVLVNVNREKLAARGLSLGAIVQAVGQENVDVPVGQIDDGTREISVKYNGEAAEVADLGNIQVGVVRGQRVYLRDIATFAFGTERKKSSATYDGEPCVVLKVTKKGEANAVAVVDRVRKAFDEVKKILPGGMELVWFRDDGDYTQAQVSDGLGSIRDGVILTGIVLLLFLADIRTAFIAFITIPVTMMIALMTFSWFGYTMNMVTMSAFGISVGVLVTNSIVVLENVARAFERHKNGDGGGVPSVVERATSQVGLAVAASALTNIVVFLPIAAMKSITGKFLAPFAVTTVAATFASLLVSFTLTPILAMWMAPYGETINRFLTRVLTPWDWFYKRLEAGYVRSVRGVLRVPVLFVVAIGAVSGVGLYFYATRIQSDFVPQTDMGDISVRLEYAADSNLGHTAVRSQALATRLAKDPAVRHVLVTNGKVQGIIGQVSEGSYMAEIQLRLSSMIDRPHDKIADVLARIRQQANDESDCLWSVMVPSIVGGSEQDTVIMVSGPDLGTLNRVGTEAKVRFGEDPSTSDVSNSVRPGRPEISLSPNRAVLHDMGVASSDLGMILRANVAGLKATTYKKGDRSYDIRVRYVQQAGREQISAMNLPGPDGRPMPLNAVTKSSDKIQPTQIVRYDKVRSVTLYANVAKGYGMGTTVARETALLEALLPSGYVMKFSGMAEKMAEAVQEFGLVMLVAILLTYLLLAALLESWSQPFIILLTVPFSYLGLYMAVYYTGTSVSIFGQLAGIMLVGVVVNAAILLIDEVNTLRREQGYHKRQAMITAVKSKFRPILMSSVAALFGMLPMAMGTGLGSEMRASIGIGSVGGMIVSSLLSLYFIPAIYLVVGQSDKAQSRKIKKDLAKIPDPVVPTEVDV